MEIKHTISEAEWLSFPPKAREYITALIEANHDFAERLTQLEKTIEKLLGEPDKNSGNSSKPPSSDPPFKKIKKENKKKGKRKRGGQKGHKGHRQKLLPPTIIIKILPASCPCGCTDFTGQEMELFYTHQVFELPEIQMDVLHFLLHKSICPNCGKFVHSNVPAGNTTGYGPRFHAYVAELSGTCGESRDTVKNLVESVFNVPISTGGIQQIIDRTSESIKPVYDAIGYLARAAPINNIDETSWFTNAKLHWLWVMTNNLVAFFMIHKNRSKEAFLELIGDWEGILISDNYRLYRDWINLRQTCLAHYIRRAKWLSQQKDTELAWFGEQLVKEIRLLCSWAKKKPAQKEWLAFYDRFIDLIFTFEEYEGEAGTFARLLIAELDSMWVFLEVEGVEPTNNHAEQTIRFGVLLRKRSLGTQSEKGNRWIERILSLRQTCRMNGISTYSILVSALTNYLKNQPPTLSWLPQI